MSCDSVIVPTSNIFPDSDLGEILRVLLVIGVIEHEYDSRYESNLDRHCYRSTSHDAFRSLRDRF